MLDEQNRGWALATDGFWENKDNNHYDIWNNHLNYAWFGSSVEGLWIWPFVWNYKWSAEAVWRKTFQPLDVSATLCKFLWASITGCVYPHLMISERISFIYVLQSAVEFTLYVQFKNDGDALMHLQMCNKFILFNTGSFFCRHKPYIYIFISSSQLSFPWDLNWTWKLSLEDPTCRVMCSPVPLSLSISSML